MAGFGWIKPDPIAPIPFTSVADIIEAARPTLVEIGPNTPCSLPGTPLADFLHLSDAQIRDQSLFQEHGDLQLRGFDFLVDVSIRDLRVETLDSFVFAAFLAAWADPVPVDAGAASLRFAVHTGDLLDVSVSSEMVEALNIMRSYQRACPSGAPAPPLYAAAGNHDGLTFGNIPDSRSKTWSLGINRDEFIMAHLLGSGDEVTPASEFATGAFGFERNEVIQKLAQRNEVPAILKEVKDAYDRIIHAKQSYGSQLSAIQTLPLAFRDTIHTSGESDEAGIQLGYYSWQHVQEAPPGIAGIRFIMLDTRAPHGADGFVGDVQLGWLYQELQDSWSKGQVVIFFAHHSPEMMKPRGLRLALRRLLAESPHVLGYFHGHGHDNTEGLGLVSGRPLLTIQTGSLADWPQVGRRVRVRCTGTHSGANRTVGDACISWSFVRPKGDGNRAMGGVLDSMLYATLAGARDDRNKTMGYRWVNYVLTSLRLRSPRTAYIESLGRWEEEYLQPGCQHVQFVLAPNDPLPTADEVFSRDLAARISEKRRELGLRPL